MISFFYNNCERVTSSGSTIRELDGLRFLALSLVFLLHLNHSLMVHPGVAAQSTAWEKSVMYAFEFGSLGVQLFFLISGFILGLPFARASLGEGRRVALKTFYLRRLTRLEPPLIIHLTVMLGLYVIIEGESLVALLPHYAATITYLHSHLYGALSPLNEMTWSLEVEAQFYLATPLLCLLFRIRNLFARRGLIVLGILGFGCIGPDLSRTLLPVQLSYFLTGFLLVDIYLVSWKSNPPRSKWADGVALASIALFMLVCRFHKMLPMVPALWALLMGLFCWAAFRGPITNRIFRLRFPATIGGMCYTYYLYHLVVIHGVSLILVKYCPIASYLEGFVIYLLVGGLANFVICSVLFVLFEKPFMRWRPCKGNWGNGLFPLISWRGVKT
ncbi:MAG: acyltransferase [Verrucomicrobiales bacterium]|nr:acyltransferase [Verrucomicrobiales bacterium]